MYDHDETEPTTTVREWLADPSHEYIRNARCQYIAHVEKTSTYYAHSYYSDFPRTFEDENVTHVGFLCVSWSDYGGDVWAPSNARSLQRDYPEAGWVELLGRVGSTTVLLPIDATVPVALLEDIERITLEYPLYDEDDFTDYEVEVINRAWDDWLDVSVKHDLRAAGFDVDSPLLDSADNTFEEVLEEDFYNITYELSEEGIDYPSLESATTAHFPAYDVTITRMLDKYRGMFPALFDND